MFLKDIISQLKPFRWRLAFATLSMMLESVAALLSPWMAGHFAEAVLAKTAQLPGNFTLSGFVGLWLLIFVCQALLRFLSSYLSTTSGAKILAGLSCRVYNHLQALPMSFHQKHKQGDVLALISSDLNVLAHFFTGTLTALVPLLLTFLGALLMMMGINVFAGLLVLLLVPAFFILIKLLGKGIGPLSAALAQAQADALAHVQHNLTILQSIKAFNREAYESMRYREKIQTVLGMRVKLFTAQAFLSPVIQLLASCAILLLLWVFSQQLMREQVSTPQVISLVFYGLLLTRPVSHLAGLYGQVQQMRGSVQRLQRMLQHTPELTCRGKRFSHPLQGHIEFRELSFGYPQRPAIFAKLNLSIAKGETVAITGANGAGKTTLFNLLLGFIQPQQGTILIDGQDLSQYSVASLRQQIGLVSQHILLSDDTIANNIRYGRLDASDLDVQRAGEQSGVHQFVQTLPQAYATPIGELGKHLSGGQRQGIALARALLKGSRILLFDEASSMLDPAAEKQFIQQCRVLLAEHTVLLVTHGRENLALADRIVNIDRGQITQVVNGINRKSFAHSNCVENE